GLQQARVFQEAMDLTGIVLTKLDGTAKGGVVVAIQEELRIPVQYIGVGEDVEDLHPFEPESFVKALLEARQGARSRRSGRFLVSLTSRRGASSFTPMPHEHETHAEQPVVNLTDQAVRQVKAILTRENIPDHGLRVAVTSGGCSGFSYGLDFET